ncbi:MAG: peptidase M1, partial [Blastocatellia bacterium]|nr:peptidase M1 [Blastocatellia bacterium]
MRALFLLLFLTYLVIMNVDALAQASTTQVPGLEPGVSRDLAQWRAKHYSNVSYQFSIEISAGADYIQGKQVCNFTLDNPSSPVVLDWRPRALSKVWNLKVNNNKVDTINFVDEHIVIEQFLRKGKNQISFEFLSPISSSGSAVTRYKDLEDGSEYIYTLFVPSDASTAFPCFDQPDLKADFQLEITVPRDWKVITNTKELSSSSNANGSRKLSFAKSEKISTYLFAFATGPFVELKEESDPTKLFVRRSKAERASQEAPEVLRLNREAIKFFSSYFAYPFPFSKYDLVLIPEFAYRGMEHAGATFLRESSILFPSTPSNSDIAERAQLIFHETAHQWFGDLVTMKWFDDLWLKEGFANFMAAKATEAILPDHNAWNIFHTAKSDAYKTDVTKGTTPIWQELTNLSAAKSAYGNIVYKKAPAILRQAEFFFGTKIFQSSVQLFVKENAYANAEWYDLVSAIERRSGQKLGLWADAWVKRRSMPDLHTSYKTKQGVITDFLISQENTLGEGGIWPMRTRLILFYQNQSPKIVNLLLSRKQKRLTQLIGKPAPKFVFANYEDFGYGRFFLDEKSRQSVLTEIPNIKDLLLRALLWEALWDDVRQAELAPIQYIELGLKNLPSEDDEI